MGSPSRTAVAVCAMLAWGLVLGSPSPDSLAPITSDAAQDRYSKVAVAEYGGNRYVYAVWWRNPFGGAPWELMFRVHSSGGLGGWDATPAAVVLTTIDPTVQDAEYLDLAISARGNQVHVAWVQQGAGLVPACSTTPQICVAAGTSDGGSPPNITWSYAQPYPETVATTMPDLAETADHVYLARIRDAGILQTVQVLTLIPRLTSSNLTAVEIAKFPAIAVRNDSDAAADQVLVAYQRADPSGRTHTYSRHSISGGATWDTEVQIDTDADLSGGNSYAPTLSGHGTFAHLVWFWSDGVSSVVMYRRSTTFGQAWNASLDSPTLSAVATVSELSRTQDQHAVAAYGCGVAVVYTDERGRPTTRRNTGNGENDSWQGAESLDAVIAQQVHVAAAPCERLGGETGTVVQYLWSTFADIHHIPLTVTVLGNHPPVAAAGAIATEEGAAVSLDASASADPDGDALQFRWDFDADGTWDTAFSPDPTALHLFGDDFAGNAVVEVSDGTDATTATAPLSVSNVAPSLGPLEVNTAGGEAALTLRVAGEKFHDVTATVLRSGLAVNGGSIVRVPGSPDDQLLDLGSVLAGDIVEIAYTPLDDPVNGQVWGATPAWLILTQGGAEVRLHHTFNVRHPDTWVWTADLAGYVRPSGVELTATATDPGSDDLTVTINWGDGTTEVQSFPNNASLFPDPDPSIEVNPRAIAAAAAHAYSSAGTYTITVTVEDDDGGVTTATLTVLL